MSQTNQVIIYTDGAAKGNPGPAGWCWWHSDTCWGAGGFEVATNNVAELSAVEHALLAVAHRRELPLVLVTDSTYVMKSLTEYIHNWKRNGWMTSAKKPVSNRELIRRIDSLIVDRGGIRWQWQKGHVGAHGNTQADAGASAAATAFQEGSRCPSGPGWVDTGAFWIPSGESVRPAQPDSPRHQEYPEYDTLF
ncbi:MAG: ribonuclease H [Actinomycetes bacterium]